MKRPEEKKVTKIKPQIHKSPLKLDSRDKLIFEGRGTSSKNSLLTGVRGETQLPVLNIPLPS